MLFTDIIKSNKEFSRVYKKGRYCTNEFICVYYLRNNTPYNKLGITVSKKLGNAVERNRAKRIIRAAYRESERSLPLGYDLVAVARAGIKGKKSTDIKRFFVSNLNADINRSFKKGKKQ
ncbi:MAG: ribonuclease P protein component [Ruminococcus sp.]|nr:ribonuclease P protein component [Ruminococcus sp.]